VSCIRRRVGIGEDLKRILSWNMRMRRGGPPRRERVMLGIVIVTAEIFRPSWVSTAVRSCFDGRC